MVRRRTIAEMRAVDFARRAGYGMVAGPASGHRECWDFDDDETFEAFVTAADTCGLGDVVARIRAGYEDRTPGGGRRWIVQYPESVEWKDRTLARRCDKDDESKIKTLIELPTFAILAPSNGGTHPTGKPYMRIAGDFETIASYTLEERDSLIELARSFGQIPKPTAHVSRSPRRSAPDAEERPGDAYNRRAAWPEILAEWTAVYERDETVYLQRPGKAIGISATVNHNGSDLLYVFTSSTAFDPEKSYTKFAAYAVLQHGGDFSQAAKALRKAGYGTRAGVHVDPSDRRQDQSATPPRGRRVLAVAPGRRARTRVLALAVTPRAWCVDARHRRRRTR
jgi:putative DNA primase/helicase